MPAATLMENATKTAPRIYVHENGKKTIDHPITNKPVIFTCPSISRAEEDAQEKIHELFDSIFEDAVDRKRESTAMQVHEILISYNQLNDAGRKEAVKRVEELTEIPRYTKPDEPPQDQPAHFCARPAEVNFLFSKQDNPKLARLISGR